MTKKRARYKSNRPKRKQHTKIPLKTRMDVVQLKAMGLTYNEVAAKTKISYQSVENIVTKWAPQNPDKVKIATAKALEELAGTVTGKAKQALEHITEDSMTHDRIVHTNAQGTVTGVSHSGPNALQLATTAGILIDKAGGLRDKASQLRGENTGTLGPSDFAQLISSIQGRMSRLTEVKADLNTGDLQARITEFETMLDNGEEVPAEYEVLDEIRTDPDLSGQNQNLGEEERGSGD